MNTRHNGRDLFTHVTAHTKIGAIALNRSVRIDQYHSDLVVAVVCYDGIRFHLTSHTVKQDANCKSIANVLYQLIIRHVSFP